MKQRLPPLPWLRAFEASARHLSFTLAAVELHLTQAAVSKQVRLLEQHLGEALFQRRPRSLALSKSGAAYHPKVADALERLRAGTEEVFGGRGSSMLTVRASVGFAVNWLAPRLTDFYSRYPQIPVRIVSSIWNDPLDSERFDLEIRYGTPDWPGWQSDRLTHERLITLCSAAMVRGPRALREPDELAGHTLLHVLGYREGWAVWLRAAGVDSVNAGQGLHFDTSLMAFEVAASGGGVVLARSSLAARECRARARASTASPSTSNRRPSWTRTSSSCAPRTANCGSPATRSRRSSPRPTPCVRSIWRSWIGGSPASASASSAVPSTQR